MQLQRWMEQNTTSLAGRLVAVTGTTGGLGRELCRALASLGAALLLLDRNRARSEDFAKALREEFSDLLVECLTVDLEDIVSVEAVCRMLESRPVDVFIHNAGAYSIPRHRTAAGFDNVFQINFASPYYIIRRVLPQLKERRGHVVVVGSIAHHYSRTDVTDVDFSTRSRASLVYGNAKRYLMFSLPALLEGSGVSLAVTHPGICFTNITAHYPRVIYALIKHPMKLIFMRPRRACLSILRGVFLPCERNEWIGPRVFDIWGTPRKRRLTSVASKEQAEIEIAAEQTWGKMCETLTELVPTEKK